MFSFFMIGKIKKENKELTVKITEGKMMKLRLTFNRPLNVMNEISVRKRGQGQRKYITWEALQR